MIAFLSGAAMTGGSIAGFWYLMPRDGKAHPLVLRPALAPLITVTLVSALAIGVAMVIDAII